MDKKPPLHHIPHELDLPDELIIRAADTYGTPLYLYDENMIRARWDRLKSLLPKRVSIYYSVKANPNISIIEVFRELGAKFEVASIGELNAVLKANVNPGDIIFLGPGKTESELEKAIQAGIQVLIVESAREIELLQKYSRRYDIPPIALRINAGYSKGSISMGGETQFGMASQEAEKILQRTDLKNIKIIGIHSYAGTGILDGKAVLDNCKKVLSISRELQEKTKKQLSFIDMGGGLGIPYYSGDSEPNWDDIKSPLAALIDTYINDNPWANNLAIESGRFLIGPAGVFISRVLYKKENGGKHFLILDGGSNVYNHDRYAGARIPPICVAGRRNEPNELVSICGPLCTTLDRLAADVIMPKTRVNDIIVFYLAGAYGLTQSPGLFLSHGYPSEVISKNNRLSLIRERLDFDMILAMQ